MFQRIIEVIDDAVWAALRTGDPSRLGKLAAAAARIRVRVASLNHDEMTPAQLYELGAKLDYLEAFCASKKSATVLAINKELLLFLEGIRLDDQLETLLERAGGAH